MDEEMEDEENMKNIDESPRKELEKSNGVDMWKAVEGDVWMKWERSEFMEMENFFGENRVDESTPAESHEWCCSAAPGHGARMHSPVSNPRSAR